MRRAGPLSSVFNPPLTTCGTLAASESAVGHRGDQRARGAGRNLPSPQCGNLVQPREGLDGLTMASALIGDALLLRMLLVPGEGLRRGSAGCIRCVVML